MKFAFVSKMPVHYSGGRYHAWNMAESLAKTGNTVYFFANNHPIFSEDFEDSEGHNRIKLIQTDSFELELLDDCTDEKLDFVIMIPHRSKDLSMYQQARDLCRRKQAKMVLLNFESPNWMNHYVKTLLDEELWCGWKYLCNEECIVLSTDRESTKYAKQFYGIRDNLTYKEWNLSINTLIADKVERKNKENRIITFIRLTDEHKGGEDILKCVNEYTKDYTFVFVYGMGKKNAQYDVFIEKLEELKNKYGVNYEMKLQLSEREKFEELARAKYLLFPSYFEGYGLPPIEAMYMETTCLAYDLPVLREICGDGLVYCNHGDSADMARKLQTLIEKDEDRDLHLRSKIEEIASFEKGAERLNHLFEEIMGD